MELENLHEQLAKADTFPENYNTQADQIRIQLLQAENQRLEREEHCDELFYILEGLQEEKKMLQREYDRMPKEEVIQNFIICGDFDLFYEIILFRGTL